MAWVDTMARGTVPLAGAAMLLLAVAAMLARRMGPAVALVAAQAACLTLALLAVAWLQGHWPFAALAAFTLAAKTIGLPLGLRLLGSALDEAPRRGMLAPAAAALALAGLVVAILAPAAGAAMAVALAVAAIGGLAMAWRRDSAGQAVGVLVLENGLVLALAAAPGLTALVLATAALPAAVLLVLLRRLLPTREAVPDTAGRPVPGLLRGTAAGWIAVAVATATLAAALALPWLAPAPGLLRIDRLAAHMAILVAASALLAAWNARRAARWAPVAALAGLMLAALADAIALTWLGLEVAVLALLLGAPRQGAGHWRALLAMVLALAAALFGAVLLARAGVAPRWSMLAAAAPTLSPALLSLGFILLLGGLAACAGLAPLQGWLRAVEPMPALAAVALAALLRARGIVAAQDAALDPGPALLAFGMASLLWATLALWRRGRAGDAAVLFHAGLASVGFGLGGGTGDAAGLLLLTGAVLMAPLARRGRAGAGLLAALALLPPFALFGAALALLGEAVDAAPWLAGPLAVLMAAGGAGLARMAAERWTEPARMLAAELPALLLLVLVLAAGVAPPAARWFDAVAEGLK